MTSQKENSFITEGIKIDTVAKEDMMKTDTEETTIGIADEVETDRIHLIGAITIILIDVMTIIEGGMNQK